MTAGSISPSMQMTPPPATNARREVESSRLHQKRNHGTNQGRGLSLGGKSPFLSETGHEGHAYTILIVTYYTLAFFW